MLHTAICTAFSDAAGCSHVQLPNPLVISGRMHRLQTQLTAARHALRP